MLDEYRKGYAQSRADDHAGADRDRGADCRDVFFFRRVRLRGVAQRDESADCKIIDSWDCYYYYDDDDDDDDGATELVMSTGLAAIGLTFTGITIAAIANAVQEQCALGPTIVYEAGTTHPYYISPNLCTIGTKTFSSDKTVRDASPRKVCRKFCEAASEKGKLALKHVQGLTCYCKRR